MGKRKKEMSQTMMTKAHLSKAKSNKLISMPTVISIDVIISHI